MKKRTDAQNKRIYALLTKTKLAEQKENLVFSFTSGKTTSSSEMSSDEANKMIQWLEEKTRVDEIAVKYGITPEEYKAGDKSRRYTFSLIRQLPKTMNLTYFDKFDNERLNYKAIDSFLKSKYFKNDKDLNALKQPELSKLNSTLEKIVDSYKK